MKLRTEYLDLIESGSGENSRTFVSIYALGRCTSSMHYLSCLKSQSDKEFIDTDIRKMRATANIRYHRDRASHEDSLSYRHLYIIHSLLLNIQSNIL